MCLAQAREETGYTVTIDEIVGVYSGLKRDPRFRAASIAYKGTITSGSVLASGEGKPCWRTPEEVLGIWPSIAKICSRII